MRSAQPISGPGSGRAAQEPGTWASSSRTPRPRGLPLESRGPAGALRASPPPLPRAFCPQLRRQPSHHPPRVAPARAARQTQGPGAKRKRVRVRPAPGRRGGRVPLLGRGTPRGPQPASPGRRAKCAARMRSSLRCVLCSPGPGDVTPSGWDSRVLGRAGAAAEGGGCHVWLVSASARATRGRAGFLGIRDQTQGALFSPSPPLPPQEQEKEKSVGNALFPLPPAPPPPSPT